MNVFQIHSAVTLQQIELPHCSINQPGVFFLQRSNWQHKSWWCWARSVTPHANVHKFRSFFFRKDRLYPSAWRWYFYATNRSYKNMQQQYQSVYIQSFLLYLSINLTYLFVVIHLRNIHKGNSSHIYLNRLLPGNEIADWAAKFDVRAPTWGGRRHKPTPFSRLCWLNLTCYMGFILRGMILTTPKCIKHMKMDEDGSWKVAGHHKGGKQAASNTLVFKGRINSYSSKTIGLFLVQPHMRPPTVAHPTVGKRQESLEKCAWAQAGSVTGSSTGSRLLEGFSLGMF